MNFYNKSVDEIINELNTNSHYGLSKKEVNERLETSGYNKLPEVKGKSILKILFSQINNPLTYILFLAVFFSVISDHMIDAYIVSFLIIVNISIGFFHEYKAEKRIKGLRNIMVKKCVVLREGEELVINREELVIGDIVILQEGQVIPADLRFIDGRDVTVVESALTGESLPVEKFDKVYKGKVALGDRKNILFMGTPIVSGEGKGVVIATGVQTEIGKISVQLDEVVIEKSLFHIRTHQLLKLMIMISIGMTLIVITSLVIRQSPFTEIAQFSFASLISGIPEGLPSVLTIVLSIASFRMAKRNALLRNLPSIETLSTVTTIITDKTGTLTQNVMNISEVMLSNGDIVKISGEGWNDVGNFELNGNVIEPDINEKLFNTLKYCALMSQGDAIKVDSEFELKGTPTEIARYVLAKKAGLTKNEVLKSYEILDYRPYSQDTKYKIYLIRDLKNDGKNLIIVVGGAEYVTNLCKTDLKHNQYIRNHASYGYRMQAVAYKETSSNKITEKLLNNLNVLSILRISDPIRPDVHLAISSAKKAGIRVIMATGDHPVTAFSIAKEAGIIQQKSKIKDISKYVISQNEIDNISDDDFKKLVNKLNVFARVTPTTKLKIAEILQSQDEVIAMTGDGVNDASAIKKADIGISMGKIGTDVAKEASDLILLDDSFSTIIDAIEEGRTVFRNVRQTSLYLITTNLAEDLMILFSVFIGTPLPLLPLQILWLNLVTDGLSDIALATEPPHSDVLNHKPVRKNEKIVRMVDLKKTIFLSGIMAIVSLLAYKYFLYYDLDKARTMAFTIMVFCQLFNVINMRSIEEPVINIGYFSNKNINISIIISIVLFSIVMFVPRLSEIFGFYQPSLYELLIALLLSSLVLISGELYKWKRGKINGF